MRDELLWWAQVGELAAHETIDAQVLSGLLAPPDNRSRSQQYAVTGALIYGVLGGPVGALMHHLANGTRAYREAGDER